MRLFRSTLFWILFPPLLSAYTPAKLPPIRMIENFSDNSVDRFPKDFRTYPFERGKASKVYRVKQEEGNAYLSAHDAEDLSVQIFRKFFWETEAYPILGWRWRAQKLPQGANELEPSKNDSPCGIYVIFGGYTGKVIKYIWSGTVPVNTEIEKKPNRSFSIVKSSGAPGSWQTITANVREDYQRLFKEKPRHDPIGFGLLTDGNATHSPSACDYDDFVVAKDPK